MFETSRPVILCIVQILATVQVQSKNQFHLNIEAPVEIFGNSWHQPCHENKDCSPNRPDYTRCDTTAGICVCVKEGMYYDETQKMCIVYAGQICAGPGSFLPCVAEASCVLAMPQNTCKCDNGETPEGGFCIGSHGLKCTPNEKCNKDTGLKCTNGICLCERENETYEWSSSAQKCFGLADAGTCSIDKDCTPGAICSSERICKCQASHSPTVGHRCKLSLNSTCFLNPDQPSETCNEDEGLVCSLSVCGCGGGTTYDKVSGQCAIMVSQECDLGSMESPWSRKCVTRATCVEAENGGGTTGKGVCVCQSGFRAAPDNSACSSSTTSFLGGSNSTLIISLSILLFTATTFVGV